MKKIISMLAVLLLIAAMSVPVFAAEGNGDYFVPSITVKDGPEITTAVLQGDETEEDISKCLVITTILSAQNQTTDVTQEVRDQLLNVYEALLNGDTEIPAPDGSDYVIRELVDIRFGNSQCITPQHGHLDSVESGDFVIDVQLNLELADSDEIFVFSYIDGQWMPVHSVVNNGDGTVTLILENVGPVAFCVEAQSEPIPQQTGICCKYCRILFVLVLIVLILQVVILVLLLRRKKPEKEEPEKEEPEQSAG